MEWTGFSYFQLIIMWVASMAVVLVGAGIKGGARLLLAYLPMCVLLGPVALVLLLFDGRKACPFCQQVLRSSVKVCPHWDHRQVYAQQ